MHEVNETISPGAVVHNRYLVIDLLGKGGFSAVYLVQDLQGENSFFALKELIAAHKKSSEHFTFESSLLERLVHPALPRVHELFENEEHSRWYMLMDYVEGPNLETLRLIQHEKRFSLSVITAILAPVVDAIEYLHQQNPPIVHRDIKPSNIIVPIVERKTVLVDFGIAKQYETQGTTSAVRYGSHGYGAPEQYSAGTNTRTDIYGLGAVLYTLLTGEVPSDALDRMTQISNDKPDPLKSPTELVPSIPLSVSRAIERAMSINMMQRFATAQEFWQAFQGESVQQPMSETLNSIAVSPASSVVSGETHKKSSSPLPAGQPPRKRSKKILLLPAFLVLLLIVAIGIGASYWAFTVLGENHVVTPTTDNSTPIAHPTVTATSTFVPNPSTHLAATYNGTIYEVQTNVTSPMTLTHIQRNNGYISGNFNALNINRTFSGSLATSSPKETYINFIVPATSNHSPLSFSGAVQPNGNLQGSYCEIDQNGTCIPNGVFGFWSVAPSPTS